MSGDGEEKREALIQRILRKTALFEPKKPKGPTAEDLEREAAEKAEADKLKADREEKIRLDRERHESLLTKPRDSMGRDEYHPGYSGPRYLDGSYKVKVDSDGKVAGIGIGIQPEVKIEANYGHINLGHLSVEDEAEKIRREIKKSLMDSAGIPRGGVIDPSKFTVDPSMIGAGMIIGGITSIGAAAEDSILAKMKAQNAQDAVEKARALAREEEKKAATKVQTIEDRFMDVILDELERFGPSTGEDDNVTVVFGRVLTSMKELAALSGTSLDEILEKFAMTEEKSPEIVALEALAAKMTAYWSDPEFALEPASFDLNTPKSLTVWKSDKGAYSKHSHIGGESFTPTKAHVGKRGHIIVTFNALATEPYAWMEMPLTDCLNDLSRFQGHFVNTGFSVDWSEILNAKQNARQAEELKKHGDKYADFGSY